MMHILECDPFDQQFTHMTADNMLTVFNTSALERHLQRTLTIPEWIAIVKEQVALIERDNGVEQEHLARLKDNCLAQPIIFCECLDGTHILVDGNHRFVYAARKGKTEVLAWLVKRDVWERFIIDISELPDLHNFVKWSIGKIIPKDVPITVGNC